MSDVSDEDATRKTIPCNLCYTPLSWHSTTPTRTPTPTPTRPTRLCFLTSIRHTLFPREDPRDEFRVCVGVRVGVVECQL